MPAARRDVSSALDRLAGGTSGQWRIRRWSVSINCLCAVALASGTYYAVAFTDEEATPAFLRHPMLMSMGLVFLTLALGTYSCKCVGRKTARRLHTLLCVLATVCIACGAVAIVANKITIGHTPLPSSPHSLLGTAAVLAVLLQSSSGVRKWLRLPKERVFRWHGLTGLLVYVMCAATYGLGASKTIAAPYGTWVGMAAGVLGLTTVLSHCLQKGNSDGGGVKYRPVPTTLGSISSDGRKTGKRDSGSDDDGIAMV